MNDKISRIVYSIGLMAISGVTVNVANLIVIFNEFKNGPEYIDLLAYSFFCVLGFIICPYFIVKKYLSDREISKCKVKRKRTIIILFLIISGIIIFSDGVYELLHNLIIALSEEILFRYIIYELLKDKFNKKESAIIGALIFAILLHLNGNFIINITVKLPFALLMYLVYEKKGIQDSIFIHWIHNSAIGLLF